MVLAESNPPMFAVLFPGQGSQFVGMGRDLFEADPAWLRAAETLDWDLKALCLEGPEEALTRTEHAQPAIYAVSMGLWLELGRRLDEAGLRPAAMAGHSLGEYSALAAARAFDFESGLRLVDERGRAMAAAADAEPSGMAALIGADEEAAEAMCSARRAGGGRLWVANVNAPGQVVVAGGGADVEWASESGRDFGVRRVVPLAVAGAFHTPFMDPARERLQQALAATEISDPELPVWSNVTARPYESGDMGAGLARQVVSPVRFRETLEGMAAAGIDTFVHVGPGDVTAGLARRTVKDATVLVVDQIDAVEDAVDRLTGMGTMPGAEEPSPPDKEA